MNLHILTWDEDSALWRTRVLSDVDPHQPMIPRHRGSEPWLAWNTPRAGRDQGEYVELESVAAAISATGDILLYYRPALEYWKNINPKAAQRVRWLEREWPTFGEVALEELHRIARRISDEEDQGFEGYEATTWKENDC